MPDAALAEVVAQVGRADLAALRDRSSPATTPGPTRRARGARPSPRRRRAGPAAASRTAAPASVRPRARARRRAVCRTPRAPVVGHVARVARRHCTGGSRPALRWAPDARAHLDSAACGESSARRATSRSAASTAARSPRPSAPAAARAPGRSPPTTRTPPPWRVEAARLARRSAPDGTALDALWFSTANPAYLDKNNASAIHAALRLDTAGGRARLRRRAALGRRRAAHRARRQRLACSWSPPTSATACPRAPTSRRAATARPRSSSATTPTARSIAEYLGARERHRGVHRALAHAGLRPLPRVGRALRRGEVRAARRAGVERGAEGGRALARPGRPPHRHRHARPRGARHRRPARRVEGSAGRRPRDDRRQHRHRARRRCCSPTRSRPPSPAR